LRSKGQKVEGQEHGRRKCEDRFGAYVREKCEDQDDRHAIGLYLVVHAGQRVSIQCNSENAYRVDVVSMFCDTQPLVLPVAYLWQVPDAARAVVQAFIMCRLDYCNSLFFGITEMTYKPPRMPHAARLVSGARRSEPRSDHVTPVLRHLHWLPIKQRMEYELAVLSSDVQGGP